MSDRVSSNPRLIFEALSRHGVDFAAVGGWAAIAHGSQRITHDVDIVAAARTENLARLEAALADLGAEALTGSSFATRAGGLDFFNEVPGGAAYEQIKARSVPVDLGDGLEIRIAGIDDLIAMKRAAGRPQDLRDIATLTHLERERRGG